MGMFTLTAPSSNIEEAMRRVEDIMTIVKFYRDDKLEMPQIADMFGISSIQVYRILKANNVKMRNAKRG